MEMIELQEIDTARAMLRQTQVCSLKEKCLQAMHSLNPGLSEYEER